MLQSKGKEEVRKPDMDFVDPDMRILNQMLIITSVNLKLSIVIETVNGSYADKA